MTIGVRVDGGDRIVRRIEVSGTVQGVGFRPFVYRLANELGIEGSVRNAGGWVVVEALGESQVLDRFVDQLRTMAPPRARVDAVKVVASDGPVPVAGSGFQVVDSALEPGGAHDIPPDIATCDDCLRELFDPLDRRYRYPFLNCTNCGPRATIIDELPYDRGRTVMRAFDLCVACASEYGDPSNRRFHAEPVACPECGPRLSWTYAGCVAADDVALQAAIGAVRQGQIVAVKGIGGYQLACDATNEAAVQRLRQRKRREAKPLAVMVRDIDAASHLAIIGPEAAGLLTSPARPIVLLEACDGTELAPGVHLGVREVGLFLPYTPLHHLLLHDFGAPLVFTSGNRSDEPIVIDDAVAIERLEGIADGFLQHDRPIRSRYDDSVARVVRSRSTVIRRARGYAPESLVLPEATPVPLLAVGAELKHTFTLAEGGRAVVGPHTGDLEDADTNVAFLGNLEHLSKVQAIEPEMAVYDLHPGYLSTQYAMRAFPADRRIGVQHHHAHVASCAAEHGITQPFIGIAYDGLGMGDDGTLWGGEFLVADLAGYRRVARFATAPLPGGAAAVRHPARMALGYLFGVEAPGGDWQLDPELIAGFTDRLDDRQTQVVRQMVDRGVNSPRASSAGRLFDAVSSLLGVCDDNRYEGEAAIKLEASAAVGVGGELPWTLTSAGDLTVYDVRPTLAAVLEAVADHADVAGVAVRFHNTIVAVTLAVCERIRAEGGTGIVCMSGGVFQNRTLTSLLLDTLGAGGFEVFINQLVPANDGGISYGQAAIAAARL